MGSEQSKTEGRSSSSVNNSPYDDEEFLRYQENRYRQLQAEAQARNELRAETARAQARIASTPSSQNSNINSLYPNLTNTQSSTIRNTVASNTGRYDSASSINSPSTSHTQSNPAVRSNVRVINRLQKNQIGHDGSYEFLDLPPQSNIQPQSGQYSPSAPPPTGYTTSNNQSKKPRSRSSTPKNNKASGPYNCPTCKCMFSLYIYQCANGHSSCQKCKNKLLTCGSRQGGTICNLPITDMRNIVLETLIGEITTKCPNEDDGCCLSFKLCDMDNHLKECPFKDMACPISTVSHCSWKGKKSQLLEHFDAFHVEHRQADIDKEMRLLNICNRTHLIYLVNLGPFIFLLHIKVDENERMVYFTVQFFGTAVSAAKWNYEVQVYNKREPRRKYQYVDICHSDALAVDDIFKEGKCAALPLTYAMTFINESSLTYKFFIKKLEGRQINNNNQRGRRGAKRGTSGAPAL